MPPAVPNNSHHNCRACSRPPGRNESTRNPQLDNAAAARLTAARVAAVTGVRPSSSKKPTATFISSCSGICRNATGAAHGSPSSAPAIASNRTRRSAIVRAIGPTTPSRANGPPDFGKCPVEGIRPGVGFSPHIPQKCAGSRIDPPPSLPTPPALRPAAIAAASPPLDPPAVRVKSQGLLVRP